MSDRAGEGKQGLIEWLDRTSPLHRGDMELPHEHECTFPTSQGGYALCWLRS